MELGLVELLRAAWIAGTLPILIASLPCSWLGSFHGLVLGFARRGKIMQSSSHHKFIVPQRIFSHFYVVAVAWTTLLLLGTSVYAYTMTAIVSEPFFYADLGSYLAGRSNIFSFHRPQLMSLENGHRVWLSVFLLLLMEVQVLRRLFETVYVFNYSASARMHICGYLTGLFFYTAVPLTLCCTFAPEALKFGTNEVFQFIVKGTSSMQDIEFHWQDFINPFLKLGWCQWIGAVIFLWGWIHQHLCHAILKCYACSYIMTEVMKIQHRLNQSHNLWLAIGCHLMVLHFVWQCFLPCVVTSLSLCDKFFMSPSAQYLDVEIWCMFWLKQTFNVVEFGLSTCYKKEGSCFILVW